MGDRSEAIHILCDTVDRLATATEELRNAIQETNPALAMNDFDQLVNDVYSGCRHTKAALLDYSRKESE